MRYFLDFDRTLFDTDAFKLYLAEREHDPSITGEPEFDVGRSLNELVSSGGLTFAPGELSRFIYTDVKEFFTRVGEDALIVTFGNAALQKVKVESAFVDLSIEVLYTGDVLKGDFLRTFPQYRDVEAIYADDRPHELERMSEICPRIRGHEMRRDGAAGDGRWPVVHSLAELP